MAANIVDSVAIPSSARMTERPVTGTAPHTLRNRPVLHFKFGSLPLSLAPQVRRRHANQTLHAVFKVQFAPFTNASNGGCRIRRGTQIMRKQDVQFGSQLSGDRPRR